MSLEKFIVSPDKEKCMNLFRSHSDVLDLDRIAKKRWKQSGCKNRFTYQNSRDIGLLAPQDIIKTSSGTCYVKEDIPKIRAGFSGTFKVGTDPFTGKHFSPKLSGKTEKIVDLKQALIEENLSFNQRTKNLRKELETMGAGLRHVEILDEEGYLVMFGIEKIFSILEQEKLVYIPNCSLFITESGIKLPTIFIEKDKFSYSSSLETEVKKAAKTKRIIVLFANVLNESHQNIIVIDTKKKEFIYFEPEGLFGEKFATRKRDFFLTFSSLFEMEGYKLKEPIENCPWFGPQKIQSRMECEARKSTRKTGYCMAWSFLFAYCKIKYPNLSEAEIVDVMLGERTSRQLTDLVQRFGAYVSKISKEKIFPERRCLEKITRIRRIKY